MIHSFQSDFKTLYKSSLSIEFSGSFDHVTIVIGKIDEHLHGIIKGYNINATFELKEYIDQPINKAVESMRYSLIKEYEAAVCDLESNYVD